MKGKAIVFALILGALAHSVLANPQGEWLAIKGARIIPVVGEDIAEGTIVIKRNEIEAIGKDISIPEGAKIIDASGLWAFPGMIDCYSFLGLSEISSVAATIDYRETGRVNPQVRSVEALRPDSMHIPITRSNGITAALIVPSGGLIAGQSGLIRLAGWTPAEMVIKSPVAMHVELPALGRAGFRRQQQPREEASKQIQELKDWWEAWPRKIRKVGLIAQTTVDLFMFRSLVDGLINEVPELIREVMELKIINTLCRNTLSRQAEALQLALASDLVVVVGGRNSSNTEFLRRICEMAGARVFKVETAEELDITVPEGARRAAVLGRGSG